MNEPTPGIAAPASLDPLDTATIQNMVQAAVLQIQFARQYTLALLDATPHDRWFEIPSGFPSNIAWQVGHLSVAQYGLLLFRLRGRAEEDLELVPSRFRKGYGKGSTPSQDPSGQSTPEELLARFQQIYDLGLATVQGLQPSEWLDPMDLPYAGYPNKLGTILFCMNTFTPDKSA
jgi:DinB superfamily